MPTEQTAEPKARSRWGRITYVLFLLVFTLVLVELGARWYLGHVLQKSSSNKFRFNSYRVYEHVPGFREGDGKRDWIVINDQGFRRDSDVPVQKPLGAKRVFFLGGSAAHGISSAAPYPVVHIYPDETVDAYLEAMLRESEPGQRIEVINAAVTGYQVFQHTQYLLTELLAYDPDLIIFFDGHNDHYTSNPSYRYMTDFRYQFWKPLLQSPGPDGTWMGLACWMSRYSAAFRGYVAWRMTRDAVKEGERVEISIPYESDAKTISNHKAVARKQFLRAIDMNLYLLARDSVKAVLCLQPMLALRDTALLSAPERSFRNEDPNATALYPVILSELDITARRWGVPVVDMTPVMNAEEYKGKQLMIDYCHLSPLGGEACAKALLPVVRGALWPTAPDTITAPAAPGI